MLDWLTLNSRGRIIHITLSHVQIDLLALLIAGVVFIAGFLSAECKPVTSSRMTWMGEIVVNAVILSLLLFAAAIGLHHIHFQNWSGAYLFFAHNWTGVSQSCTLSELGRGLSIFPPQLDGCRSSLYTVPFLVYIYTVYAVQCTVTVQCTCLICDFVSICKIWGTSLKVWQLPRHIQFVRSIVILNTSNNFILKHKTKKNIDLVETDSQNREIYFRRVRSAKVE